MPEGDTVYRTAAALHAALAGKVLTRCDIRVPRYATVDLSGHVVDEVIPRGKHLLIRVGDATIHSHLKMEGAWHVYRPGQRWRRPAFAARAVLGVAGAQAVGFDLGILEVIERRAEHGAVGHLGPDLLGPDWDSDLAAANLARDGDRAIGEALLDQSVLAGVGNIYRSELCFLRGVRPETPVARAGDPARWAALAHRLLTFNKDRVVRVTTGDLRRPLWVYGRGGRACLRCGAVIAEGALGEPARGIFWCPRCQRR
ncbi:DNA-formamidopyrimidine glycosylase family protein [Tomitella biformata]|uniref:DNA-formamidopyrimidine glycosylase family protein n=1 Tax=Tomitella biformata TaxID=630403 RepID=UPI0004643430|nr:DNA-formamidopyrimidine glycosylase family protein [Tomitella biformata]